MSLPTLGPEFHDIAKRVNNWGRWGSDDEIGTLNLITDEVVRAAAAEIRTGRRIPLALPLQQDGVQTGMVPGRVNPCTRWCRSTRNSSAREQWRAATTP